LPFPKRDHSWHGVESRTIQTALDSKRIAGYSGVRLSSVARST